MTKQIKTPQQIAREAFEPFKGKSKIVTDIQKMIVQAIEEDRAQRRAVATVEEMGLEVQVWTSAHDGVDVVQIDTPSHVGRLRVNVNDAAVWDADPSEHEHARCACVAKR